MIFIRRIVSVLIVCFFVTNLNVPVLAGFNPKSRKPPSKYSQSIGSRGCSENGIPLTLLAPRTYVSKTVDKRPTLVWYMSTSKPVIFTLFDLESKKEIVVLENHQTITGINKLTIPENFPELSVGKTYLWQISIPDCQDLDSSLNYRAEFTVEKLPPINQNKLKNLSSRVDYFAENDLWYNALGESLKNVRPGKLGQIASTLIQELAQSEIISGDEAETIIKKQHVENLLLIADGER